MIEEKEKNLKASGIQVNSLEVKQKEC